MLDRLVKSYLNGMLTNEEVISELMKMARDITNAHKAGNAMGLSEEELAFYDALTRPEAVKDFYTNEQLIAITRELTRQLRKSRTVDWEKKESARAGMRRMVKRLLKKYDYPPETILSHTFYRNKPEEFYRFYRDKLIGFEAKPNQAHEKLAQWEKEGS